MVNYISKLSSLAILRQLLLLVVISFLAVGSNGEVVKLTDITFEHQTQATTGSTTGSWFILFHSSSDEACEVAIKELDIFDQEVTDWLYDNSIVLASVDVSHEVDTKHRFSIESVPTFRYIHKGSMYPMEFVATTTTETEDEGEHDPTNKIVDKYQTFLLQSDTSDSHPVPIPEVRAPQVNHAMNSLSKAMEGPNGMSVKILVGVLVVALLGIVGMSVMPLFAIKKTKAKVY